MEQKRSLFGPLFLILAGMIWLLIKGNIVPTSNLWALTHVWSLLLIAAGLGIIFRQYWVYASIVMDMFIIGVLALTIFYAPQIGWDRPSSMISFGENGEAFFGPGVRGSGVIVRETRKANGFNAIRVDYPARVIISQGSADSVRIEADDNLLPGLKTELKDDELRIYYKPDDGRRVNPTEMVKITIVVKQLSSVHFSRAGDLTIDGLDTDVLSISLDGAGNVKLNELTAKELDVNLSGAGSMTASGTAENANVNISGFGDFRAGELHTKTADITISGAGSATAWVDEHLIAELSGAGAINYYGNADVNQQINGVGSVKHLGDK